MVKLGEKLILDLLVIVRFENKVLGKVFGSKQIELNWQVIA
jgi:hypothetical protein